jgi:hypothetical protein
MSWFSSEGRSRRELDRLISRLDTLGDRIGHYEEQERLSARLGMPGNGQVAQSREAHSEIYATLTAARAGIHSGEVDQREIYPQLPSVEKAVNHMEWILNEADKDVARAKRAFHERFGGN